MNYDEQRHFNRLIRNGFTPEKAMEIATGPFARFGLIGLKTSSTFNAGAPDPFAGSPNPAAEIAVAKAKARAAGVSIEGKRYITQLAEDTWDPKAWVSDETEVAARCRERGLGCQGAVSVKASVPVGEPERPYAVDEKIVNREADLRIETEKLDVSPKEREQIKGELRTQLSGTHYD